MIDEIFEKFDGAFAENTIRAYRSDFEQYSKWCETKNISPIPALQITWQCMSTTLATLARAPRYEGG
jgi:site-specific recombinase XerD